MLYKYKNTKRCHIPDDYVPDDLEKINKIIDGTDNEEVYITEENETVDDAQFKTINKTIHNEKAINNSANYKIMTEYLSKLKKTFNGKILLPEERLNIVKKLLENDTHFTELTEKLFTCSPLDRDFLLPQLVEFPLECMASYIQCTQNSNSYLRRKYFDGQIRKRKDGTTYKREHNIFTEADLVQVDEEGKEYSPLDMAESTDIYFDNAQELLSIFNEQEKEVLLLMDYFSSGNKATATINDIIDHSNYTKRQIETIKIKIKYKALKWLNDNRVYDTYNRYYQLCKNYKDFEKNYAKFIKKCEKTVS